MVNACGQTVSCKPVIYEPGEWRYVMTLVKALLPELSFHRDGEAAAAASRLGGVSIEVLRDFDWGKPAVYMPPFERVVDGTVVVAVEGYTAKKLMRRGVRADVVVSDLDFDPEAVQLGKAQVIHVHGDNFWRVGPGRRVYTVQTWPVGCTFNISGFTDGDRAVYLAYYMGAREVDISGFYPDIPLKRDDAVKRKKLAVAQHLLARLSQRLILRFI